jgi:hypothetical protein
LSATILRWTSVGYRNSGNHDFDRGLDPTAHLRLGGYPKLNGKLMRQVPERNLWIGNAGDLREPRAIFDHEIQAVIELADNEPFAALPRDLIRCRFPLSDGGPNASWLLRLACEAVAALLRAQVRTLVCCSNGMSRSVCVAAGSISLAEGVSLHNALTLVADSGPADVAPELFDQLQKAMD